MARIPDHDYSVSALDEIKLYSVVYTFQLPSGEWCADTWNLTARTITEAIATVDTVCDEKLEAKLWDAYEITNANVIRR